MSFKFRTQAELDAIVPMQKPLRTALNERCGFPSFEEDGAKGYEWKLADADAAAEVMWNAEGFLRSGTPEGDVEVAFFDKVYGIKKSRQCAGRPKGGRYATFPWQVNPTVNYEFDEFEELLGGTGCLARANEGVSTDEAFYGERCESSYVTDAKYLDWWHGKVDEDPTPWW